MKKKRVLIVGLPLFAKRLETWLRESDSQNKYIALDTYYNKWHKLLAIYHVITCDILYSINGTLNGSGIIDLAFKLKKRVILHWVGSDVTNARKQVESGKQQESYLNAEHYTNAPWLKKELELINIDARVQSIAGYDKDVKIEPLPKHLSILIYLPENRAEFYGKSAALKAAEMFPDIKFLVVGDIKPIQTAPQNIEFIGWVNDVNKWINKSVATIRYMEHDGLSGIVLESLARGRYVFYNRNLEGATYVENLDQLLSSIKELKDSFISGQLAINQKGIAMIRERYQKKDVIKGFLQIINS